MDVYNKKRKSVNITFTTEYMDKRPNFKVTVIWMSSHYIVLRAAKHDSCR